MKTSTRGSAILAVAVSAFATISFGADVTDQVQYLANPAKYYYPKSDITNYAARCCSRIKAIGGRLYIGLGNYTYNTGPTPVVALSPQTGTFTNEYSAGTEAIDDFKVFSNGKVYVPSLDPREASSSILGHFFIRSSTGDNGTWSRNKGIPAGVVHSDRSDTYIYTHCWDLAEFDGKIHFAGYGTASATFSGNSMGTFSDTCPTFDINEMQIVLERFANGKWQYKTINSTDLCRLYSFLEVDGALYAMQNNKFAPGYDGSLLTNLLDNSTLYATNTYLWRYSPSTGQFSRETNSWARILPSTGFDDALFTDTSYSRPISTPVIVERTLKTSTGKSYYIATMRYRPLGVYRATISSADGKLSSQKIDLGANTWPADIIEADGKVRILAFSFDSSSTTNIVNKVFESSDGESFSESFRFNHRQIAASFEHLDNTYYFGFGMSGCSTFRHAIATNYVMSTEHNGEIWKYSTSSQPDVPPGPGPDDPPDPPDPGVEADHWTYDSAAGTISDGIWTFNATVSGANLTVGTCTAYPDSVSRLDFAKPVQGAGGTAYTIKALNTAMVAFSRDGGRPEESTDKGMAAKVGELRLPATGLTSIGQGAFCRTVNCTNVVNYLPDSVASIGNSAFAFCGAKQDLFLRGFSGSTGRGIFYSCGIKSITFGPGFKGIGDTSNKMASFQGCSSITNVVFDPAGSGISLAANAFQCKPTLKQPLVLYGVTSVASSAFSNWKIPSITFADGIQSIGTLSGVTMLTNVCFLGAPPSSQTGTWADYSQGTAWVPTSVPYEFRQQWWSYAEGYSPDLSDAQKEELIKETGTTFSSTYATSPSKRPLLLTGVPSNPDPDPDPDPNPGQLRLVAPEDGAVYDTIPWQVRTFLDNPELRSEYPDDDIIAAQDTDGNHYVLNAWMTNLLAQASATGSGSPFKWSCEGGTLCDIAVEYSEDEAFTSPIVERYASDGATATRPRFLKTGTAYWWRVRGTINGEAVVSDVRRFTTQADAPRLIGVPAFNCRDFGGGTNADGVVVRQGLVIRGKCPPARVNAEIGENKRVATPEYYREFFINKLGIKTDLDFRSVSEAQEHQQKYGEIETSEIGINHVFYPITPYHLSLASNREPIRDMFRMLAEGTNYPVYCHCAVGSDRTGTFGVLLDGLLGRTDEHIYNNYELPSFDPGLARLRYCRKGSEMFASLEPRQDGHHMRDVVVDYLLRLGLTRDELKAIRRAFLVFDGPDDYIDNFTSPKAVYDSSARRLTFYCDSDDHTGEGLVVYKTSDGNASWYGKAATNAQQVVFDPSFAKFHPAACSQWFEDMSSLTNISGMAYLDTSRATAFQNMFRGCKKLPSIDFSHFDTRKVAGMQSMFYDCEKLTTLNLSSFNTRSLTVTSMMFYNCSALKTIYVGWGFSVAKVKGSNGDNMFRKASKLKGGCGTVCDGSSNIGAAYAHIDTADNPGYFTLAPGAEPLDPACVPLPAFSGDGASAPRLDAEGRFTVAIGNAVAGGRYRLYATPSLSEPFEPVGEAVTASADGALEFAVDTNGAPSMFVKVVAE